MRIVDIAVALLGASCGFASAVWAIIGWSTLRARHVLLSGCYLALVVVNVFATGIIVAQLLHRPIDLPQGTATLLLLPLIILPPSLQLRSWMESRRLLTVTVARADE